MGNFVQLINKTSTMNVFGELFQGIISFVGNILWGLCDIFFVVLNLFEDLFRRLAGISTGVTDASGEAIEGDLVLYLINSNLIQNIFFSILILSLFLLIIFTIFAIVKNQYADKPESVTKIINSSVKALLMYLMVPIATVVCLIVGNIVLQAIDGATRTQTSGSASDMLFVTAAYNANKLRDTDIDACRNELKQWYENGWVENIEDEMASIGLANATSINFATREQLDAVANLVDEHFVGEGLSPLSETFSKWEFVTVTRYYNILEVSLLIVWVGGAFLIWAIGKMAWGLLSRMFKMTLYFAISPAVMAVFPIKGESALKSWTGEMVKQGTLAYSAVGVLNVLYSVLPFFNGINLFGTGWGTAGSWIANQLIKLFIYIVAFTSANSLIDTIGGWFGLGNIVSEGKSVKGAVTGKLSKSAVNVGGAFMGFKGGFSKSAEINTDNKKPFRSFMKNVGGGLTGAYKSSGAADAFFDPIKMMDDIRAKEKVGADYYKGIVTSYGPHAKENKDKFELKEAIDKEVKAIDKLVAALEKRRDAEIAKINADTTLTAGQKTALTADIADRYLKQMNEAKASAEHLTKAFADRQKDLDVAKQGNEQRQTNYNIVANLTKSYDEDERLRKLIEKKTGETIDANSWQALKEGNDAALKSQGFGFMQRKNLSEAFDKIADDVSSNDRALENAKASIKDLFESGGDSYLKGVLNDGIGSNGDIDMTKIAEIKDAVKRENDDIKKAIKDWKDETNKLIADKAKQYDDDKTKFKK